MSFRFILTLHETFGSTKIFSTHLLMNTAVYMGYVCLGSCIGKCVHAGEKQNNLHINESKRNIQIFIGSKLQILTRTTGSLLINQESPRTHTHETALCVLTVPAKAKRWVLQALVDIWTNTSDHSTYTNISLVRRQCLALYCNLGCYHLCL